MTKPIDMVGRDYTATEKELAAAQLVFEAAVIRGEPMRMRAAEDAAHAALQNRLDAFASLFAVVKRDAGRAV